MDIKKPERRAYMRDFSDYNPAVAAFYYLSVAAIAMFTMNPVLHVIAFIGGIAHFCMVKTEHKASTHIFFLSIGIILSFVRPIFSHNGATVLFVVNDNPITGEAFIYGINAAVMVVGVLYVFRVFSVIMTSDRLLYLFGGFSPKTALVLSMGLRYIPMLRHQRRITAQAQKALGINKDDNVIDRIKGSLNVFSATLSWGLENGIITADSMASRRYGEGKRSRFKLFRMHISDYIVLGMTVILSVPVYFLLGKGSFDTSFYPVFKMAETDNTVVIGYVSYGILLLIPIVMKAVGEIRWRYLMADSFIV